MMVSCVSVYSAIGFLLLRGTKQLMMMMMMMIERQYHNYNDRPGCGCVLQGSATEVTSARVEPRPRSPPRRFCILTTGPAFRATTARKAPPLGSPVLPEPSGTTQVCMLELGAGGVGVVGRG